jgi:hypothetical protein
MPTQDQITQALITAVEVIQKVDRYGQRLHATQSGEGWTGPTLQELIDQALTVILPIYDSLEKNNG